MATVRHSHTRSSNHSHSRHPGMKKQLENVFDSVRDLGSETKHAAQEQVSHARSTVDGYVRQGKKRARAMEKSFEDRIREEPVKALLVASGIGFLCGLFLRRR
jgi:ElaB/YqjD/DUF883 family membrane-anchored ribosome-binding protein